MAWPCLVPLPVLAMLLVGVPACSVDAPVAGSAPRSGSAGEGTSVRSRPSFVPAGEGEVDAVVRQGLQATTAAGDRMVVYVGASWCEPCEAFHQAVERGELDEDLAGVRFLEFDSDRHGGRLPAAGYGGRLIPRFVLPLPDGRGSEHRTEGGIPGDGAVEHIMARLRPLLARERAAATP
jgi:thiol-disulfide isomerase/thioredoxin